MTGLERLGLSALVVAAFVLFTLWCLRRHQAGDVAGAGSGPGDVLVAWASQTGTATALATRSFEALGGQARLLSLDRVDDAALAGARRLLVVASTYGSGEPPDNGARFARRQLRSDAGDLSRLEFAVLALGDSSYAHYCRFGHDVHQALARRGARPLAGPVELDARRSSDASEALAPWAEVLQALGGDIRAFTDDSPESGAWASWTFAGRELLNPGSPGEPLVRLVFTPPDGAMPAWRAGDIAELVPEVNPDEPPPSSPIMSRKYSIASIPEDGVLEFVVRRQRNADGHIGLASGWLADRLEPGEAVEIRLSANPNFHAPFPEKPLVLIGNGSGIAGLRALLRCRARDGGRPNWLVYGERDPAADRVFDDEIGAWQDSGGLDRVDRAFSRCPDRPRYVQDCLREKAAELSDWVARGAVLMVCGSRTGMAQGVDEALSEVLGRDALDALDAAGRYRREIY